MIRTGFECKYLVNGRCDEPGKQCNGGRPCHISGRCPFCRNRDTEICRTCGVAPAQTEDINSGKGLDSGPLAGRG